MPENNSSPDITPFTWATLAWWIGGLLLAVVVAAGGLFLLSPAGSSAVAFLNWLFAADSVQVMWYITRASGLAAYVLMWFSMAWGLAVASKITDTLLHRAFTYDFHQFVSLLMLGFVLLHIGVLLFDRYMPYSLLQILVPFISPYRPLWVGIGVIGFYLAVLVTVTYYMRGKIGMKAFRAIHVLSLLSYLGITLHSFLSGTDSTLLSVQVLYTSTFLVTLFLMIYWLVTVAQKNRKKNAAVKISTSAQRSARG
jgi:predicted ferric reductase